MKRSIWVVAALTLALSGCAYASSNRTNVGRYVLERDGDAKLPTGDGSAVLMSGHELTMDRAVEIALHNNASLKASLEELGIVSAGSARAGLPPDPVFSGSVRYPEHGDNASVELSVETNFLGLVLTPLRRDMVGAQLRQAEYHASHDVLDLAFQVRSAYRSYQAARQVYRMREDVVRAAKAAMDLSARQKDAGNLSELDAANHRAAHAEAGIRLTQSEAEMNAAREELNRLMGHGGGDVRWEVSDELPPLASTEPHPDELQVLAMSKRLDLLAAHKEVEARRKGLVLSRAGLLEDAAVGIETEREPDGERLTGPSFTTNVPIFDLGHNARRGATARLRQSEYQLAALENGVRSEVKLAYDRLTSARKRAQSYRDELLPARTQVIDQTQKHYNFMLLGVYALLEAKRDQIDTYQDYIGALRDYWIARSDLEKAIGARIPVDESGTTASDRRTSEETGNPHGEPHHHV